MAPRNSAGQSCRSSGVAIAHFLPCSCISLGQRVEWTEPGTELYLVLSYSILQSFVFLGKWLWKYPPERVVGMQANEVTQGRCVAHIRCTIKRDPFPSYV